MGLQLREIHNRVGLTHSILCMLWTSFVNSRFTFTVMISATFSKGRRELILHCLFHRLLRKAWKFAKFCFWNARTVENLYIPLFLNRVSCKVSYDFLLCRRLLFTADPQYPAVTFYANLPSLVLHINEHKVGIVTCCVLMKVYINSLFMSVVGFFLYSVSTVQVLDPISVHCLTSSKSNQSVSDSLIANKIRLSGC